MDHDRRLGRACGETLEHRREEPGGARRAGIPDPTSVRTRSSRSVSRPGAARGERTALDGFRELPCEPGARLERCIEMEQVGPIERAEAHERPVELSNLPGEGGRPASSTDRPGRHPSLPVPLDRLLPTRERAGELLEAHVQRAVGSVRFLDVRALLLPRPSPSVRLSTRRCGADPPTGAHRQSGRRPSDDPRAAGERRPVERAIDGSGQRAASPSIEEERDTGALEMASAGEDLFDVPETPSHDRREEVDVNARRGGPTTPVGRACGAPAQPGTHLLPKRRDRFGWKAAPA